MTIYEEKIVLLYEQYKEREFTFYYLARIMNDMIDKQWITKVQAGATDYHYYKITPKGAELAIQLIEFTKI